MNWIEVGFAYRVFVLVICRQVCCVTSELKNYLTALNPLDKSISFIGQRVGSAPEVAHTMRHYSHHIWW